MKTYHLNPAQAVLLGFALGTSSADTADVNQVKRIHGLVRKTSESDTPGSITVDDNEAQYLASVIEMGRIVTGSDWPELNSRFQELSSIFATGAKGTQEGARSAAGR